MSQFNISLRGFQFRCRLDTGFRVRAPHSLFDSHLSSFLQNTSQRKKKPLKFSLSYFAQHNIFECKCSKPFLYKSFQAIFPSYKYLISNISHPVNNGRPDGNQCLFSSPFPFEENPSNEKICFLLCEKTYFFTIFSSLIIVKFWAYFGI